jgi:hypothetical protein
MPRLQRRPQRSRRPRRVCARTSARAWRSSTPGGSGSSAACPHYRVAASHATPPPALLSLGAARRGRRHPARCGLPLAPPSAADELATQQAPCLAPIPYPLSPIPQSKLDLTELTAVSPLDG